MGSVKKRYEVEQVLARRKVNGICLAERNGNKNGIKDGKIDVKEGRKKRNEKN